MAIQLSAPEPIELKAIPYPQGFENQFERFLGGIIERVSSQYINKTVKQLHVSTVEKFTDAPQTGNWATAFVKLDSQARRDIRKNFPKDRINKEVSRILNALNRVNQTSFYKTVDDAIGVDVGSMIKQEGLSPSINALVIESQRWVNKELDDTLAYLGNNALRIMAGGASYDDLLSGVREEGAKRTTKSRLLARNQLSSFNGLSTKIRQQKVGIEQAVWSTSKDERVRDAHAWRDGKTYDLDEGLYSSKDGKWLYPGTDYLCRCTGRPIIPMTK